MAIADLAFLLEARQLAGRLNDPELLLIDLRGQEEHRQGHIPGALALDYAAIIRAEPPVGGLLPDEAQLSRVLAALGLRPVHHVVAYDGEGGGYAGRLLWTLEALGHEGLSLLNGGINAWLDEGFELSREARSPQASDYRAHYRNPEVVADRDYILSRLQNADFVPLDARSPGEYQGSDLRAARGGHIPGAVNLNWTDAIDFDNALRFKPDHELRAMLETLGATPDKEIVAYCQTHHRSSHTYMLLKHLAYPRRRGYPGSWSEWGNDPNTPVES